MKAFEVIDKSDPNLQTVIAFAESRMKAKSLANKKFFKKSRYFDLIAKRCPKLDNYFTVRTIITGEDKKEYSCLEKAGWLILNDPKKTEF